MKIMGPFALQMWAGTRGAAHRRGALLNRRLYQWLRSATRIVGG
jgi:hypothetical protein